MIAVLKAVLALVPMQGGQPVSTALFDGTGHDLPLVIGTGTGRGPDPDAAMGGRTADFSARLRLCCMADDAELALKLAESMVDAVTPGGRVARLNVPGRFVQILHVATDEPGTDTALTNTDTNQHPGWCWVHFDVRSQPLPEVTP